MSAGSLKTRRLVPAILFMPALWLAVVFVAASGIAPALAQTRADILRKQFDNETDPVKKAKLLLKLGDADFQEIRQQVEGEHADIGAKRLEQYRDDCRAAGKALDSTGVNPEKKPAGFKELQFSIRSSLRRMNDIAAGLSADEQKQFEAARKDLESMDRKLLRQLFPRQSGGDCGSCRPGPRAKQPPPQPPSQPEVSP